MKNNSVLIVGCGDLGTRTGLLLLDQGWRVTGLRRNPAPLPQGFTPLAADYCVSSSLAQLAELQPTYVLATFLPRERSAEGYRSGFVGAMTNLLAGLADHRPQGICMVSSTRVFAEQRGGWVDESSELTRTDHSALAMIEAEQRLGSSGQRTCIVRFGGIYGARDSRLLARVRRGELCARTPARYSNRMHRDDCAGFLAHLLLRMDADEQTHPLYIGVDDLPAPQFEVESWLAMEMGIDVRPVSSASSPPVSHKRCRNDLLHESGYTLRYPDYRSGYREVLGGGPIAPS